MPMIENYYLNTGAIFVSGQEYLVSTVLGSCVSVCIWDSRGNAGGMNHYIYSNAKNGVRNSKYGDISINHMLNLLFKMGAIRNNLKAHIVGGGQNPNLTSNIGEENIAIAEEILRRNRITIVTRDIGGQTGRKVIFNNISGEILVYKGINVRKSDWYSD